MKDYCFLKNTFGCQATNNKSSKRFFNWNNLQDKKDYKKILDELRVHVPRNKKICEYCTSKLRKINKQKVSTNLTMICLIHR